MALRIHRVIEVIGGGGGRGSRNAGASFELDHPPNDYNIAQQQHAMDDDRRWDGLWFLPDNASNACHRMLLDGSGSSCASTCPERWFWWRILHWMKRIVIKIGHSYYALPTLLIVTTLCMGLVLGFLLGRRYEQKLRQQQKSNAHTATAHNTKNGCIQPHHNPSVVNRLWWLQWIDVCYYCFLCCNQWFEDRIGSAVHRNNVVEERSITLGQCTNPISSTNRLRDGCKTAQQRKQHSRAPTGSEDDPQNPCKLVPHGCCDFDNNDVKQREEMARIQLKSEMERTKESSLSKDEIPQHIAVIMDGNRRYGQQRYGNKMRGHWDGSQKLLQFVKWCIAEQIAELTVYAFSTENWSRDMNEVATLMEFIRQHCEELRIEAIENDICVVIQSTQRNKIPASIRECLQRLERETRNGTTLRMNICLSYGSRDEIVHACRNVADDYKRGHIAHCVDITEDVLSQQLLIRSEPDILLRTSGEIRLSNFLLWQLAYTEMFFLDKKWPELEKQDLIQVLHTYARGRQRRFGK